MRGGGLCFWGLAVDAGDGGFDFPREGVEGGLVLRDFGDGGWANETVDEIDVGGQVGLQGVDSSADKDEFVGGFVGGSTIGGGEILIVVDEEGSGEQPAFGDGLDAALSELFEGGEAFVDLLFESVVDLFEDGVQALDSARSLWSAVGSCATGVAFSSCYGLTSLCWCC